MKTYPRTYLFFIALILAANAPLLNHARAAPRIEQTETGSELRFEMELDSLAYDRFDLQFTNDFAEWSDLQLSYDVGEGVWALPAEAGQPTILTQQEGEDGRWTLTLAAPFGTRIFARSHADLSEGPQPVDSRVHPMTRNLLRNLHRVGWDSNKIMMGHEFPLSFTLNGSGDSNTNQSDIKDVVGDHPGVHGSDFHFLIDKSAGEIARHLAAARKAFADGGIVTFDHHWPGKYGGSHSNQVDDDKILDYVVRNDDSRGDVTWFYARLDRILGIVNNDLKFPIVFRPFHEMDGNWFWWGRQIVGGTATYKQAYQILVEYMSARSNWILFCWSPDVAQVNFSAYYPGDDYVDVVGRDLYRARVTRSNDYMVGKLEEIVDFADLHGKVAAFTETGYNAGSPYYESVSQHHTFWTANILTPILASEKASKIAWILTWVNTSWSGPYVPHANSPQAVKTDFIQFYNHPATLFQSEVAAEKMYD